MNDSASTYATSGEVEQFARFAKTGFDEVSDKLHEHDRRFTGVENRLGGIERRLDGHDRRFDAITDSLDEIKLLLKRVVTRREHERLKKKVLALAR
ncbi:MAG: hypothetical protein U0514_02460 [Candidatus Andersenbacteria bacterium]